MPTRRERPGLNLFECQWSSTARGRTPGLDLLTRLLGEENVVSRNLVTSSRQRRVLPKSGVVMEDSGGVASLA
ncbi:MAG: hypothetical protein COW73_08020 [Nitrospirae bacterium CG18_big_fil_WC_8_21_14_2_50_70_55]|nr:MAG: hypothetical protein AUK30_03245 [Nitrospirae bacterium CG2_30_70_394]PIQ04378.1 MAG: hypothetical protein COW73_08020 [Nitrospirae bacterium CG18_big_fil_WC_8_21_14_2_50_70_55]PIU79017.1 MAG: hypothetical protein COS73_05445 [Nitrospirae bacterium CG06_land_8_20_14_3_00_70_43]PIW83140.1 MAG: hypothetical protein COZ96_04965 [Nitrospirae bacterium CG_4_8_14_3_um_filter_70_85]PIX83943.1 MAG: hypothetical protein COZ33_02785 [Nitrospirae bacterium CG_4_10_14_3_um_filter_70_108]PJB96869.1